ncbi:chromosome segregation protein SMC [Brevibacterium sp. Marseille-P9724]|uniref:chromosome segregation protein SMC n=1 Tax=Brevibacterium sp. Marseille-P9724 TaxID=2614125 RepID=UPI00125EC39D|nr:chromosome segregation protein SMC [Brevibacterium sp. Marseille-P9724]
MFLKTLSMRGFKSFASATRLELEPGITCVVGPNGSGKSNVVDALAWVMGEQGAKNLRGGKMEDVIFAGTSKRQALGRAEVSLTIDNADGAIPIDYTEVTISRTLFRSGGSEYAVNGAPARLLDIQELLSDSGLGKEMHVIVGQGQLDQVLHADPFERRGIIEEAAGVLKHRRRKEKAVRKLNGLQTNLDRLQDLRAELARQLGPLGKQARAAQRAATVQAELRDASARLLADDIVQTQAALQNTGNAREESQQRQVVQARIEQLEQDIAEARASAVKAEQDNDRLAQLLRRLGRTATRATAAAGRARDRVEFLRTPAQKLSGDAPEALLERAEHFRGELSDAEDQQSRRAQSLEELAQARNEISGKLDTAEAALKAARAEIAEKVRIRAGLESDVETAQRALEGISREKDEAAPAREKLLADIESARAEAQRAEAAVADLEQEQTGVDDAVQAAADATARAQAAVDEADTRSAELTGELRKTEARIEALQISASHSASADDLLALEIDGVTGRVEDLLEIEAGFETAAAAALGPFAQALFADTHQAGLALLENTDGSTDVDTVIGADSHEGSPEPIAIGSARRAVDVVSASNLGLRTALRAVLSRTVIVEESEQALALLQEHPDLTCVTRSGTVIETHRVRRSGRAEAARAEARNALAEAQGGIDELALAAAEAAEEVKRLREALREARSQEQRAQEARRDAEARIIRAQGAVTAASERVQLLEAEVERLDARSAQLDKRQTQAEEQREKAQAALAGLDTVDAEPGTEDRDRLAQEHTQLGEEVMEARIAARSADDRVRFLADRIDSLRRKARAQQAERERLQREEQARKLLADRTQAAGEVAEELAQHLAEREKSVEAEHAALQESRTAAGEQAEKLRENLDEQRGELAKLAEAEHAAALKRERFVLRLEELNRRAEQEIGLSAQNLIEQFGPHLDVPDFTADVDGDELPTRPFVRTEVEGVQKKAEREMKRIGKVNPLALEEFTALQERHDYLEKQINDIEETREDLRGMVSQIDELVKEVFAEAFADTAREFTDIFSRLFPGGEGSLSLTDPDDMLTTGVEVFARPAGKRVRRLSLLSGGERSLVAVAILVAIFKARPSPFYVMDEVEAALDDVNLSRLLGVFKELQESSQLIVITHQKRTMEIADALYGVTMGGDGISKVVSQRLVSSVRGAAGDP